MRSRRVTAALSLAALALCLSLRLAAATGADTLPARLSDEDYWRLVQQFSERAGTFPSDNLLSNERTLQTVIPELTRTVEPGGVYLGVGPEQNFTYIVALRPRI